MDGQPRPEAGSADDKSPVAVVGLSHLGCVLAAAWSGLGHPVAAFDFDPDRVAQLAAGVPPIYEPGLEEAVRTGLAGDVLSFSTDPKSVAGSPYVFLSYDTPVRDDDTSDLSLLRQAVEAVLPFLDHGAVMIVSSQLPVGTARQLRRQLQDHDTSLELVYSPENLRLGDAIHCYLQPGHVAVGCDNPDAGQAVLDLFRPIGAETVVMDLPTAEMVKHCINSFLATSVTLANQWADLCASTGADYFTVARTIKLDPRIGVRAYVTPGLGFSGGTLGRDLRVLDAVARANGVDAPLFGTTWRYNAERRRAVGAVAEDVIGDLAGRTVACLGMTYKAGTSSLRRSVAVEVACDLASRGAKVRVYDPKADWTTAVLPTTLAVCETAYVAAEDSDLLVLLTEWPEFAELDYAAVARAMAGSTLFDTKGALLDRAGELEALGLDLVFFGRGHRLSGSVDG
ncbi:MAG: nucleotide sugar dehydrogenase [Actinomycetota bacterium]|nr:nucleotide sugar dehydrogenase [Actinomycetota bacterium]